MASTTFNNIVSFIRDLYATDEFIPLHAPVFLGREKEYLNSCIESTFVSSVGKFVDDFELAVQQYTGAKRAIVTMNGTNALSLALNLVGVRAGDEVITQALTFVATANAIAYLHANPVFLDVDKENLSLSATALEIWLSTNAIMKEENGVEACFNVKTGKRIAACVPMHTFGHPAEIDKIVNICDKYKIPLVEDAAESLGSFYKGQHTGTFGLMGVLSFNGNKTITTGGGGMLLCNDEALGKKIKHLTTQAKVPHPWKFNHDEIGYNLRMPNINAALGLAQMENINRILENKRETASRYKDFFSTMPIDFFTEPENAKSNYWLNAIIFEEKAERDEFLKFSNEEMVMTRPPWDLMNSLPMFKNAQCDALENSKWICDCFVNIPSSYRL